MLENPNPPSFLQNRYRLVEWLGRGGMGVVYRARDETLGRDVAIKFLLPEKLVNEEMKSRFAREARAIARLSHPNIITIYDVGEDTARDTSWHYLVLEYVPGTNIKLRMQHRGGALPLAEALEMIRAVLNALAYAHAQGVIHRDLKPENIMLTPEGQVKVSDFGSPLGRFCTNPWQASRRSAEMIL